MKVGYPADILSYIFPDVSLVGGYPGESKMAISKSLSLCLLPEYDKEG